ncbi:MAG: dihydrofolate reductase [Bacteroidetes bacterium]|nr:dihydrofolate reductase [Bacteroidota bacterium]
MKISIIAARSENNVIGFEGKIPWKIPSDLQYFKNVTEGHYIIMGRKTFDSIDKRPLPNRTSIVISRNPIYEVPEGVILTSSIEKALRITEEAGEKEAFIIGGQQIYALSIPIADFMYITEIECHVNGDAFFPEFDGKLWKEIKFEKHLADERNEYNYSFRVLKRR